MTLRRAVVAVTGMVGVLLGVLVWTAPAASAHATVSSTDPGQGSVVKTAPSQVSVVFDEAVEIQFGALRVFSPGGQRVDAGDVSHAPGHADTVTVGLKGGLAEGTYTVAWRVISADSHPVAGGFTFSIGKPSATSVSNANLSTSGSRTVGVLFGVARWAAYLSFALLAGGAVFLFVCWPGGAVDRRVRVLLGAAWAGLVAATVASLGLNGPYGAGFGIGRVFDWAVLDASVKTRLGEALVVRLVLLALAAPVLVWVVRRLPEATRTHRMIATVAGSLLAVGTTATWAAADHASTGMQVPLALPVAVVHLMAMAVWLGGLTVLAAVLLPRGDMAVVRAAVPRFSGIAFGCVTVLAVTGTYQAWRQVGTLPALTSTAYGRLVLLKIGGFLLLIGLGYLARTWIADNLPDRAPRWVWLPAAASSTKPSRSPKALELARLRRSVAVEVVVGACVLAFTAILVNAEPGRTAYAAPVNRSVAFDTGGPGGTGTVNVIVDPAKAGSDTVHLYILDPTGQQHAVAEVDAALLLPSRQLGPLPIQLTNAGPGHYLAATTIPIAGAWQLRITVRTDDISETAVTIPVEVR